MPSALATNGMTVGALNVMLSISVLMVTSVVPMRPSAKAVVGAAPIASASASPAPTTSALVSAQVPGDVHNRSFLFVTDRFRDGWTKAVWVRVFATGGRSSLLPGQLAP